jgi:hypothetical protein
MPIQIIARTKVASPIFVCNHCHARIKDAADGNYHWTHHKTDPSDVFFTHKSCSQAFREAELMQRTGARPDQIELLVVNERREIVRRKVQ